MSKYKKTKIVATLGPATSSKETLTELASEGVNVFRINFSHADYDIVKWQVKTIREIDLDKLHFLPYWIKKYWIHFLKRLVCIIF